VPADFLRFVRELIALRKRHQALRGREFFRGCQGSLPGRPDIVWHGIGPGRPDLSSWSRSLALVLANHVGNRPNCVRGRSAVASGHRLGPAAAAGRIR
jgi:isoamylase